MQPRSSFTAVYAQSAGLHAARASGLRRAFNSGVGSSLT